MCSSAMAKVIVTGHHGYIGSVLVGRLLEAGHEVLGIDSFLYEGCDFGEAKSVPELRLDVRDVGPEHLQGADAVVHLAALSNDPLGALQPELTRQINRDGTLDVARAAKEAGVTRFVFASSCSMYGGGGGLVDENAELSPLTEYARSKVDSERGLLELADDSFSPVLMRNATVYGVSPRLRIDLVLNNLVGWAHTTGQVRVLSDGSPWRPLIHVDDLARATTHLIDAKRSNVHAEAFNVGATGENYQVRELAELALEAVPGSSVEYAGEGEPDARSYQVDFRKFASRFPDFRFLWTAREGAQELASAYRERELGPEAFESDRYVRLRRIDTLVEAGAVDAQLRRTTSVT